MNELVFVKNNIAFTTSQMIADGVGHSHSTVLKLIRNSMDLEQLRELKSNTLKTKGRHAEVFDLSEEQATLVVMLMKNSPVVRKFKSTLAKEFFKQRKMIEGLLSQNQNAEWIEKRQNTKAMRKECTDVIQEFIAYAKQQGSKSAEKYYMNFSRMELTGLFLIEQKFPNARDVMNIRQLHLIEMADEAVAISLKDSMSKNIPYKECYQIAKDRICLLAKIFPPSPLPLLLEKSQ
jgi:phage regulator Rha-like protein